MNCAFNMGLNFGLFNSMFNTFRTSCFPAMTFNPFYTFSFMPPIFTTPTFNPFCFNRYDDINLFPRMNFNFNFDNIDFSNINFNSMNFSNLNFTPNFQAMPLNFDLGISPFNIGFDSTGVNNRTLVSSSNNCHFKGENSLNLTGKGEKYKNLILKYAKLYDVDANLVAAVIKQESGFNPRAVSSAGCKGLMQLSDATAKEMGVTDPFDPEQNIKGGTRYLKSLLDKFSKFNNSLELALAGYNAGPNRDSLKRGEIPNIPETKKYVREVKSNYSKLNTIA